MRYERYPQRRYAAWTDHEEGDLVDSILELDPRDILDENGYISSYEEDLGSYSSGPGRAFGHAYIIMQLSGPVSREEMKEAEAAMEKLKRRLDAYRIAVGADDPDRDYGETWTRFGLHEESNGVYLAAEEGGLDV